MTATHQCPGPKCRHDDISADMLACPGHWYQVPQAIRNRVWAAWADGLGQGTAAHTAAIAEAVATMHPFKKDAARDG